MSDTETRAEPTARTGIFDTPYGELLFATVADDGITAEVWTTFSLNDCPPELFGPIDAQEAALSRGATLGIKNGPRFWLIDELLRSANVDLSDVEFGQFGGLDMVRVATVTVDTETLGDRRYRENTVARRSLFTWKAGRQVYELTSPDGVTYVMQAYSQIVDPTLVEADLAGLGDRLELPDGWSYSTRVLDADLEVDTREVPATVIQDELQNTYSRLG